MAERLRAQLADWRCRAEVAEARAELLAQTVDDLRLALRALTMSPDRSRRGIDSEARSTESAPNSSVHQQLHSEDQRLHGLGTTDPGS